MAVGRSVEALIAVMDSEQRPRPGWKQHTKNPDDVLSGAMMAAHVAIDMPLAILPWSWAVEEAEGGAQSVLSAMQSLFDDDAFHSERSHFFHATDPSTPGILK